MRRPAADRYHERLSGWHSALVARNLPPGAHGYCDFVGGGVQDRSLGVAEVEGDLGEVLQCQLQQGGLRGGALVGGEGADDGQLEKGGQVGAGALHPQVVDGGRRQVVVEGQVGDDPGGVGDAEIAHRWLSKEVELVRITEALTHRGRYTAPCRLDAP